jgi:hypothetical protein
MGVTVGEVEAVFRATDEVSAAAASAGQSTVELIGKLALARAEAKNAQTELRLLTAAMADMGQTARDQLNGELNGTSQRLVDATQRMNSAKAALESQSSLSKSAADSMQQYGVQVVSAKDANEALGTSTDRVTGSMTAIGYATATAAVAWKTANIVNNTAEWAHEISNLADQTDIATDKLQALSVWSQQYGVGADQLARSISMLSKRIAGDDDSARNAMLALGLSMADLKKDDPYTMFVTVADAIGQVSNQQEKALLANEAFGRGGTRMLAEFNGNVQASIDKVKDMGLSLDPAAVKAVTTFDTAMQQMGVRSKVMIGESITGWGVIIDKIKEAATAALGLGKTPQQKQDDAFAKFAAADGGGMGKPAVAPTVVPASDQYEHFLEGLEEAIAPLNDEQQSMIQRLSDINELSEANAKQIGVSAAQYKLYVEDVKEASKALQEQAQRTRELDAEQLAQYQKTTAGMAKNVATESKDLGPQQQIEALAALDAAERRLAEAVYGQITSEKDRLKVVEDAAKRHLDLQDQIIAKERQLAAVTNGVVVQNFNAKTRNNAAYGLDAKGNVAMPGDDPYKAYNNATDDINVMRAQAPGADVSALEAERDRQFNESMLKAAQAADRLSTAQTTEAGAVDKLTPTTVAAASAFDQFTGVMVAGTQAYTSSRNPTNSAEAYVESQNAKNVSGGINTNTTAGMGAQLWNIMQQSVPKFANGGSVDRPTLAMIGDGGEVEHVVPDSKIAKGGNAGGSAPVIHVHEGAVQVVNPVMTDPRSMLLLRQAVGTALISGATQTRRF